MSICVAHNLHYIMCNTSNALVRSHLSYGITQCYLPPDRDDSHAFNPACCRYSFIDPGRMKGWVDLGGWLYQYGLSRDGHPSTPSINRVRPSVTTLIETNTLPGHHQEMRCRMSSKIDRVCMSCS